MLNDLIHGILLAPEVAEPSLKLGINDSKLAIFKAFLHLGGAEEPSLGGG